MNNSGTMRGAGSLGVLSWKRIAYLLVGLLVLWAGTGTRIALAAPRFTDVPQTHWAYYYIETIAAKGIASGCTATEYCPSNGVDRAQIAAPLLKAKHGGSYAPPAATGTVFADVPTTHWAADWIEQLAAEGVTGGCGGGNYCPDTMLSRAEMAIFMLRTKHGGSYVPPAATGTVFADVPSTHWAAAWIEQLAAEGATEGCGGGNYCPDDVLGRDQMAALIVKVFGLGISAQDITITVPEDTWSTPTSVGGGSSLGTQIYIEILQAPSHGAVQATPNDPSNASAAPTVSYRGALNYVGADAFTYRVCDTSNQCSAEHTAAVTVTPLNDPPTAQDIQASLQEDTNDAWNISAFDADSTTITGVIVTQPAHGTATAPEKKYDGCATTCGQLNGTWFVGYTPNTDYYGTDSFQYKICDDQGDCSPPYTVTVTVAGVNDAPVLNDFSITTSEDASSAPYPLNATDADGTDVITYSIKNNADPTHGVASISGDTVSFMPHVDWTGTTTFQVEACDNNSSGTVNPGVPACDLATVTVTVTPANDPPTASDLQITVQEDSSASAMIGAVDVDSSTVTGQIVTQPVHGTATAPEKKYDGCAAPCGQLDGTYFVGYTPAADYFGPDSFEYKICDDQGDCSQVHTVTIDVLPVNDPPQAAELEFLTKKGIQTGWKEPIVLDPDPDQTFTVSIVSYGKELTPFVDTATSRARISVMPSPGFAGETSFIYQVCDQDAACLTATANVTVLDNIHHKDGPSGTAEIALVTGGYPRILTGEYPVTSETAFRISATGEKIALVDAYDLEFTWNTSTSVGLDLNGANVLPGETVLVRGYDFSAAEGKLVMPTAFTGAVNSLTPGAVGELHIRILDPETGTEYDDIPNIQIPIASWSIDDGMEFVLQGANDSAGAVAKVVEKVSITARQNDRPHCDGQLLGWKPEIRGLYPRTPTCGIEWMQLPQGIEAYTGYSSSIHGRFINPARPDHEEIKWRGGLIQEDENHAIEFLPSVAGDTVDTYVVSLIEPPAPQVDFSPTSELSKKTDWVPSGYWPTAIGDDILAGYAIGITDYDGLVVDVDANGKTTTSTSIGGRVNGAVKTNLVSNEDTQTVTATVSYLYDPTLTSSLSLEFMATPDKPALFVDRVVEAVTGVELPVSGKIGQYDRVSKEVVYDEGKYGKWVARLYLVDAKGERTQLAGPVPVEAQTGEFVLSTMVTPDMGPRTRMVVEAKMLKADGTENPGAVIDSSVMNIVVRDATPITVELSTYHDTGPVPFLALPAIRPTDTTRYADIGEIRWEYSTDGVNYQPVSDVAQRAYRISQRLTEPGKRWYRATTINRYSGTRSTSNVLEVQAYRTPKIEIEGFRRTFVGHPVEWKVTNTTGDLTDYVWEVHKGSVRNPVIKTQTGDTLTLDADEINRYFVRLTATPRDSGNIPSSKKIIVRGFAVQPPYLRRPAVAGPRYAEVGNTYTFMATNGPIFHGTDIDLTLSDEWELPNGAIVPGNTVDYTIQPGDEKLKYRVWVNGFKAETLIEVEKTFYAWAYQWPTNWEIVTSDTNVTAPARLVLFTQTSPKADIRKMGLEKPVYSYSVPPDVTKTYEYGNKLVADFTKPGTYPVEVIIEDSRGNQELAVLNITVTDPPPLTSDVNINVNDRWSRAPAYVTPRLVLHNPISGEKVTSHKVYLDGVLLSDKPSIYVDPVLVSDAGTHEIMSEITMDSGRYATAAKTFDLIEGELPQCSLQYTEYAAYTTAQLRCTVTMGYVKKTEWYATYEDTNTEEKLGLSGFYGIFHDTQLARGIQSLRIVVYNDKGQVTEINSSFP